MLGPTLIYLVCKLYPTFTKSSQSCTVPSRLMERPFAKLLSMFTALLKIAPAILSRKDSGASGLFKTASVISLNILALSS